MPSVADYLQLLLADKEQSTPNRLTYTQQTESQSNAATRDPPKPHTSERFPRPGLSNSNSNSNQDGAVTPKDPLLPKLEGATGDASAGYHAKKPPRYPEHWDQEQSSTPTSNVSNPSRSKLNRPQVGSQPPYAQAAVTPKDPQLPKPEGSTDDASAGYHAKKPRYPEHWDQEQSSTPTSNVSNPSRSKLNRPQVGSQPPYAQAAVTPKDSQRPKPEGATGDTSAAGYHAKKIRDPEHRDQEQSSTPTSNVSNPSRFKLNRPQFGSLPPTAATPKDPQLPKPEGSTDDTSAKRGAGNHGKKPQDPESRDQEQSSAVTSTSNPGYSNPNPLQHSSQTPHAQVAHTSKDPQRPKGATGDTSTKGSATLHAKKSQDVQMFLGHPPEDGQQDKQSMSQAPSYSLGAMGAAVMSFLPTPTPKDKYQQLKEDFYQLREDYKQSCATIDIYDRELIKAHCSIDQLQHESQRSKETISGLQNELLHVQQQLEDARTPSLSEVRGKKPPSQVDRVNALNEEIFQAAATLGEALIHKRRELFQTDLDHAAVAVSKEMVGEKMTNILITQAQKPEPEVNPLLVQVVLQVFMVNFCVSKIQRNPGDPAVEDSLSAIHPEIRSPEEQEVPGRWRARWRARALSPTRPSTETWKKELYQKLQSILVTASWTARSSENEESYGNRLPSIFRAINGLLTPIGGEFTADRFLGIIVYRCGVIHDRRNMEDAYGDGGQSGAPEAIVGTTGIGLKELTALPSNAKDLRGTRMKVLIPAKIVLWSTLNEALERIVQSTRKKKHVGNTDGANQDGRD